MSRFCKHLDNPKHCKAINSKAFLYILAKSEVLCLSNKHTQASYVCVFYVVLCIFVLYDMCNVMKELRNGKHCVFTLCFSNYREIS